MTSSRFPANFYHELLPQLLARRNPILASFAPSPNTQESSKHTSGCTNRTPLRGPVAISEELRGSMWQEAWEFRPLQDVFYLREILPKKSHQEDLLFYLDGETGEFQIHPLFLW